MDEIVFEGKKYIKEQGKWTDTHYMAVHETLQIQLNRLYLETLDYSQFGVGQLLKEGDRLKNGATYDSAIAFYEKAIEQCNEKTLRYILPRITSCYRALRTPGKAVRLFADAKEKYGEEFLDTALLTSVAAAYCDMREYEKALSCCRWAYKNCGGESSVELNGVFCRIKKDSGII